MRHILIGLFCLISCSLAAETIENVEYFLPKQDWKMVYDMKTDQPVKSVILTYAPSEKPAEHFITMFINQPMDLSDQQAVIHELELSYERGARIRFSEPEATFNILDISPQSALLEYTVKDDDQESDDNQEAAHGWMRLLTNQKETITLTYETQEIGKVNELRPIWLKALQEAKFINKEMPNETHQ
jgi:hypothetical protein